MGREILWLFNDTDQSNEEKNRRVYGELVQVLDDRSLLLLIRDAKNDGQKAIEFLRDHSLGESMPRILSLYTQLTSLTVRLVRQQQLRSRPQVRK